VHEDKLIKTSTLKIATARLPWLLVCMGGELISGMIMEHHAGLLEMVLALSFFIPVLMDMGGNVGTQSSTITVRGLATGELRMEEFLKIVWAETKVGIFIGAITGLLIFIVTCLWQKSLIMSIIVGLSLCITVVLANTFGTLLPLVFNYLKVDPAIASSPLITTIVDILGLLVYFGLGTFLFKHF
jgi:magnesium transporter